MTGLGTLDAWREGNLEGGGMSSAPVSVEAATVANSVPWPWAMEGYKPLDAAASARRLLMSADLSSEFPLSPLFR